MRWREHNLWVTGWRTCFTQPTGLSVMKIKLLFNILTTRGYLRQLEGNKYHIRGFEEQFSWEDHMQELNLERQASFGIWQWGEKNSSQGSPTKVRTCRNLPYYTSGPERGYSRGKNHALNLLNRPCSLMGMLNINQRFIKDINQKKKKKRMLSYNWQECRRINEMEFEITE